MSMRKLLAINDAVYGYEEKGVGESLILLHGFTGTKSTWKKQMDYFSDYFHTIAIDLPGHGETETKQPKTMESFARDLQAIIGKLQLHSFHLLGYSLGGRAALSYAIYCPGNIRSLLLVSASPGLKAQSERLERKKSDAILADKLIVDGIESFVDYWENIPLFKSQQSLAKEVRRAIRTERLSQSEQGLADSLRYMGTGSQESWWNKLSTLNFPVALIVGEWDKKFISLNKQMEKKMKNASFYEIPCAGHAVHLEQAEKFATIVMEYINQLEKRNEF